MHHREAMQEHKSRNWNGTYCMPAVRGSTSAPFCAAPTRKVTCTPSTMMGLLSLTVLQGAEVA